MLSSSWAAPCTVLWLAGGLGSFGVWWHKQLSPSSTQCSGVVGNCQFNSSDAVQGNDDQVFPTLPSGTLGGQEIQIYSGEDFASSLPNGQRVGADDVLSLQVSVSDELQNDGHVDASVYSSASDDDPRMDQAKADTETDEPLYLKLYRASGLPIPFWAAALGATLFFDLFLLFACHRCCRRQAGTGKTVGPQVATSSEQTQQDELATDERALDGALGDVQQDEKCSQAEEAVDEHSPRVNMHETAEVPSGVHSAEDQQDCHRDTGAHDDADEGWTQVDPVQQHTEGDHANGGRDAHAPVEPLDEQEDLPQQRQRQEEDGAVGATSPEGVANQLPIGGVSCDPVTTTSGNQCTDAMVENCSANNDLARCSSGSEHVAIQPPALNRVWTSHLVADFRLTKGCRVKIRGKPLCGVIEADDGSDRPYHVLLDNGEKRLFTEKQVEPEDVEQVIAGRQDVEIKNTAELTGAERPTVGSRVVIKDFGITGVITDDDGSSKFPYQVQLDNGTVGVYNERQLALEVA